MFETELPGSASAHALNATLYLSHFGSFFRALEAKIQGKTARIRCLNRPAE